MFSILNILICLALTVQLPRLSEAFHFEWLVPLELHNCCDDLIPNIRECKSIEGAVFNKGTGVVFLGGHYVVSRFKSNHFPEILLDQSVKNLEDWDFAIANDNGWVSTITNLFAKIDDSEEVEAALLVDNDIIVRRGENYFKFKEVKGRAVETYRDCREINPALCDADGERTEAVATFWGSQGERYVQAFHYKLGQTRGYRVSVTKGKEAWQTYQLTNADDSIDAIVVYRHSRLSADAEKINEADDDKDSGGEIVNYGVYFNLDGMACKFRVSSNDLESRMETTVRTNLTKPNFASTGLTFFPSENCFPANVFLGCPQSWCYNNDVDDVIVARVQVELNNFRDEIVVYRGHYFWKADADRGIPIIPGDVKHQFLSLANSGGNERTLSYVDAAEAFSIEANNFLIYFLDNELFLFKGINGESEIHVNREFKGAKKLRLGFDRLSYNENDVFTDLNLFFPGKRCVTVDTLWYNKFETMMYLFCGPYYERYRVSYDRALRSPKFTRVDDSLPRIDSTWPTLPRDLDGVFALGSSVYFLKGQWFWTLSNLTRGMNGANVAMAPDVAFGSRKFDGSAPSGLYATQQRCGYSDEAMIQIRLAIRNSRPSQRSIIARQEANGDGGLSPSFIRHFFIYVLLGVMIFSFMAFLALTIARNNTA